MLVPGVAVGDYVLVHAGFAISVLDEAEAQETYDLFREIGAFDEGDAADDEAVPADEVVRGDEAASSDGAQGDDDPGPR
jgi:hydrogenase expression/formation protein HypC